MSKRCVLLFVVAVVAGGCTVKAVGDPKRPITIEHHIVIELRETASSIEDYVSGEKQNLDATQKEGAQK